VPDLRRRVIEQRFQIKIRNSKRIAPRKFRRVIRKARFVFS